MPALCRQPVIGATALRPTLSSHLRGIFTSIPTLILLRGLVPICCSLQYDLQRFEKATG